MKRSSIFCAGIIGLALGSSNVAHAQSCDDIVNMVSVNVPTSIIVDTIAASGKIFTNEELRCLMDQGAPQDVIDAAKKTAAAAPKEEEDVERGEVSVQKRPSGGDSWEDTERIGEKRGKNDAYQDDLPEEGEEAQDNSTCGQKTDEAVEMYRANKPLGASKLLFDLLEEGTCADHTTKMHYYLARSLMDLEMYHSAQYYFMQVVKMGPADPYFKHALPKVVAIARYTGDDSELLRVVPKIPPEEYPRQAKNHLYYLMGVRLYDQGNLTEARNYFAQISTKSDLYLKSKYFEGVILNQQDKLKSAVKAFRDVIQDADVVDIYSEQELGEVEALADLSVINIARIYYRIQRFDEASRYYSLVPRESAYWPEALFEAAWANFMQNDLNYALGQILTVHSPFFSDEEFVPEARLLRALTFFNLCEYDVVEKELLSFEGWVTPMYDELRDFVQQYSTKEGKALADQAFEAYFEGTKKDTVLPKSMFSKFLRNTDLAALVRHLQLMDEEEVLIEAQKSLWKDSVGAHLKKVIEEDRRKYKQRAGLVLLSEMARMSNHLGDLLTQSEIIRFEVISAQRADYTYKISGVDLLETSRRDEVDFATSVDFIYWPFNGEFWQDELGYYYYTEQGSCK